MRDRYLGLQLQWDGTAGREALHCPECNASAAEYLPCTLPNVVVGRCSCAPNAQQARLRLRLRRGRSQRARWSAVATSCNTSHARCNMNAACCVARKTQSMAAGTVRLQLGVLDSRVGCTFAIRKQNLLRTVCAASPSRQRSHELPGCDGSLCVAGMHVWQHHGAG